MTKAYKFHIESENPPIVELDSEAHAAYIRFSRRPVAKTKRLDTDDCIVTIDYDSTGETIGVELIGVQEFRVDKLLENAGISPLSKDLLERASYVPAPRREVVAA